MKQTEIGLIPDDWEVKNIIDILIPSKDNLKIGPFGSQLKKELLLDNGIYKVFGQENIYTGDFKHCYRFLTKEYFQKLQSCELKSGDFVISTMGTIGKCDIVPENAGAGIMDGLSATIIRKLNVLCLPKQEQQRIAKALSDVDAVISTTEKLIQKKKNIKQGTMQNLLTGKKRLPGFAKSTNYKQSELGLIPEDWEVKSLGEIAETFTGLTYSPENVSEHGTLVLRSSNIKNEQLCFEDNVFVQMSIPERAFVKENDILICVRNGSKALIGKSCIITKAAVGMAFGAFMTVLRSSIVNQNYLLYVWQSDFVQKQVADNLGATINQITNADFKKFNVIISPNRQEQTAIANVLSSMDKEIETLNTKLEKYHNLKTAMMQQLLTGKIRLK